MNCFALSEVKGICLVFYFSVPQKDRGDDKRSSSQYKIVPPSIRARPGLLVEVESLTPVLSYYFIDSERMKRQS